MEPPFTLPFETFWNWVVNHPNCILRAGTPQVVFYDDEDFHWLFAAEGPVILVVQILLGKRLIGEMLFDPEQITYVQGVQGQREGEHVFELVSETERDHVAAYYFVLAHGYEDESDISLLPGRVH